MYNSIISNAIRKNHAAGDLSADNSYMAGAGAQRGGTSNSRYDTMSRGGDGKVTVGLSTSSSMRSHALNSIPNLVPQKTNVLTGATTKYFANQPSSWK